MHSLGAMARMARSDGAGRARNLRFVRRVHRLRTLGLGLGALCVASVLRLHHPSPGWWLLLFLNGLLWPHLAMLVSTHSADPKRAEMRNLIVDAAMGGAWIAVMEFNLLPSVLLATMLLVDKVSVGGRSLFAWGLAGLVAGCAVTSAALGFPVAIETPMAVMIACLPFLVLYPISISAVSRALARKVSQQNQCLQERERTDGLTGLNNRRQCFALAEAELERRFRTGRPAVLMIVDIDHFKSVNDRFGHPVGDDVLRAVAEVLRNSGRVTDTTARYGGDEFLLVLPETDVDGAEEVADRILERIHTLVLERAPELRLTVSIGAAEADRHITSVDVWVQQADDALCHAKATGRDRFMAVAPE
jgi:diguanylate cyclase